MTVRSVAIVGLVAIALFAGYFIWKLDSVSDQREQDRQETAQRLARSAERTAALLAKNQETNLKNRVKNVHTWCEGINDTRDYLRQRAKARRELDPTVKPFTLGNLNCEQLARDTAASGKAAGE